VQVLQRGQFVLDAVVVSDIAPDIAQLRRVLRTDLADVLAAPAHLALVRQAKPADDAQQAGLAAAVRAVELHHVTGHDAEIQAAEQGEVVADAGQAVCRQRHGVDVSRR
jgi:hypothetical protein